MDEALKWLLINAGQIGVSGLLLTFLFSLHKGWVVLGSTHDECIRDRDASKAEVEVSAKALLEKIERLEQEVKAERDRRGARR